MRSFSRFLRGPTSLGRLILLATVVGVIAGIGAIAFTWLLEISSHIFLDRIAGFRPTGPAGEPPLIPPTGTPLRPWLLVLVPALGGLLSGWIVYRFAPEAAGHGTDAAIEAYHFRRGEVRGRVPLVKAIASAITIGSGGSAGREGPIAQIGSGFGSILSRALRLTAHERRILTAAGMAAGIGAIFHAPLAAALFAAEILYRDLDLEHEVLVPAFISSIVAYCIYAVKFDWSPVFATPEFTFENPAQLLPYAALAGVVALGAFLYIRIFYGMHAGFERLPIPRFLKPALGGLAVGLIGFGVQGALGTGYGVLQGAFFSEITVTALLLVAGAKILTTSLSVGSGGSGGVFGPAVVIGGCLGGVVGLVARDGFPGLEVDPGAFVLVGMAGFFAAAANCPISTIIMVSEMTGNYHLLVPSMFVCVLAYLLLRRETLYEKQLESRLESPSKMGHMLNAVLRKIEIRDAVAPGGELPSLQTVPAGATLREMLRRYSAEDQSSFPVVDPGGELQGVVLDRDLRRALADEDLGELVVARDLARSPETLTLEDTLLTAVRRMALTRAEQLVVVDPAAPTRPVALLDRNDVVRAYDRELLSNLGS